MHNYVIGNERGKCQLPSCENRMSIKGQVLKILAREYILFSPTVSPQLRFADTCQGRLVKCVASYDISRAWIFIKLGRMVEDHK